MCSRATHNFQVGSDRLGLIVVISAASSTLRPINEVLALPVSFQFFEQQVN